MAEERQAVLYRPVELEPEPPQAVLQEAERLVSAVQRGTRVAPVRANQREPPQPRRLKAGRLEAVFQA